VRMQSSTFKACRPSLWTGRYARIPGDYSVFHLNFYGDQFWPSIVWNTEDGIGTCWALESATSIALAEAVESAKRKAGGSGGGIFTINEHGQVLVPASDGGGRRFLAGQVTDGLQFDNPFDDEAVIDLADDSRLQVGDPWKLPYVGFPFNLSGRNEIYFNSVDDDGRRSVFPRIQDAALISALRSIRRSGGLRFIVNYAGIVLTKFPVGSSRSKEDSWQPVYAGRINSRLWFDMESHNA
jgi:hypothetical protein